MNPTREPLLSEGNIQVSAVDCPYVKISCVMFGYMIWTVDSIHISRLYYHNGQIRSTDGCNQALQAVSCPSRFEGSKLILRALRTALSKPEVCPVIRESRLPDYKAKQIGSPASIPVTCSIQLP
jgi:hypothetical protein